MSLRFGSASRPAAGHDTCSDVGVVIPLEQGALLCMADGLGHGSEARAAAEMACRYARAHAGEPLDVMMRGIDAALSVTRGAAVSLLELMPATRRGRFVGVGNVELRAATQARIAAPTSPGVVGRRAVRARVWDFPLADGDVLVLLTDGISSRFELEHLVRLEPTMLAEELLRRHHKGHDDGSCIAAKVEIAKVARAVG